MYVARQGAARLVEDAGGLSLSHLSLSLHTHMSTHTWLSTPVDSRSPRLDALILAAGLSALTHLSVVSWLGEQKTVLTCVCVCVCVCVYIYIYIYIYVNYIL